MCIAGSPRCSSTWRNGPLGGCGSESEGGQRPGRERHASWARRSVRATLVARRRETLQTEPVAVLIVDDQAPFSRRRSHRGCNDPRFRVAAEADSGEDAVSEARNITPGLVLMDINLPAMNGIDATRQILAEAPDTVVILLSHVQLGDLPADAASCGAAAYVHKDDFSGARCCASGTTASPEGPVSAGAVDRCEEASLPPGAGLTTFGSFRRFPQSVRRISLTGTVRRTAPARGPRGR